MGETMDREFGWEDQIENDGADFVILPEGDYDFPRDSHPPRLPSRLVVHSPLPRCGGQALWQHYHPGPRVYEMIKENKRAAGEFINIPDGTVDELPFN